MDYFKQNNMIYKQECTYGHRDKYNYELHLKTYCYETEQELIKLLKNKRKIYLTIYIDDIKYFKCIINNTQITSLILTNNINLNDIIHASINFKTYHSTIIIDYTINNDKMNKIAKLINNISNAKSLHFCYDNVNLYKYFHNLNVKKIYFHLNYKLPNNIKSLNNITHVILPHIEYKNV